MDEAELNAIRAARLAELQKNSAPQGQEEKFSVLAQVLEPSARERLARVRIVRPERADQVEQYLVKMLSMGSITRKLGSITRKLGEADIVELLDSLSRDEKKLSQIVFERRDDSDDDFFD